MSFEKPYHNYSTPYKKIGTNLKNNRTIFYGEVISIDDETDSNRIKVRIPDLDKKVLNENLVYSYPLLGMFLFIMPKVGEVVRVFIEDIDQPQRSRFWLGSIISQPHKIEFDSIFTALSTTNVGLVTPEKAPSTYPDAKGIYPEKEDIGIIGRLNTDILLKPNRVILRSGKHINGNKLKLNIINPAEISLNFDQGSGKSKDFYSNIIVTSNKIALISHEGNPKIKSSNLTPEDRLKIFESAHPIIRGDLTVEVLKVIVKAVISHIHGYSGIPADKAALIDLEKIDFEILLQKNIVTN